MTRGPKPAGTSGACPAGTTGAVDSVLDRGVDGVVISEPIVGGQDGDLVACLDVSPPWARRRSPGRLPVSAPT
jgi:hypothetical protein